MTSVTFIPASVKSKVSAPLHKHEKRLKSCMCYKNICYICFIDPLKIEKKLNYFWLVVRYLPKKFSMVSMINRCTVKSGLSSPRLSELSIIQTKTRSMIEPCIIRTVARNFLTMLEKTRELKCIQYNIAPHTVTTSIHTILTRSIQEFLAMPGCIFTNFLRLHNSFVVECVMASISSPFTFE